MVTLNRRRSGSTPEIRELQRERNEFRTRRQRYFDRSDYSKINLLKEEMKQRYDAKFIFEWQPRINKIQESALVLN